MKRSASRNTQWLLVSKWVVYKRIDRTFGFRSVLRSVSSSGAVSIYFTSVHRVQSLFSLHKMTRPAPALPALPFLQTYQPPANNTFFKSNSTPTTMVEP
jgi:hypothetical protein